LDGEHVFITGRLKEVLVLSNGEKVAPAELEMAIMLDGLFSQILVIGEGRPYLTALTVLDPDVYPPLAQAQGLSADDPIEERLNPRLEEILIERVNERLQSFPGYAKILRIAVVKGPWTIDSGLLTPTLKLKRANILKQFNEDIERLYEGHA
jgi:long-chain acyl-CoA synthetase